MQGKKKEGRGGYRKGAGRKPNYIKALGLPPKAAACLLALVDEEKLVRDLMQSKSETVRLEVWRTLREMTYGKPKQAMQLNGGIGVAHLDLNGQPLSDADLQKRLDEIYRELGLVKEAELTPETALPEHQNDADGGVFSNTPAPEKAAGHTRYDEAVIETQTVSSFAMPSLPAGEMMSCDKHGPYKPKSRFQPACPACQIEWETQNRGDQQRLASLLPGEPGWSRR